MTMSDALGIGVFDLDEGDMEEENEEDEVDEIDDEDKVEEDDE